MRKITVHLQSTLDNRIANSQGTFWEPFPWGEPAMAYVQGKQDDGGGLRGADLHSFLLVTRAADRHATTAAAVGVPASPRGDRGLCLCGQARSGRRPGLERN
jgi:hypothetical protein